MSWQSIETAPKDGRRILIADDTDGIALVYWCDGGIDDWLSTEDNLASRYEPKFWCPVLPPPGYPDPEHFA